jgi:hypothetical protein
MWVPNARANTTSTPPLKQQTNCQTQNQHALFFFLQALLRWRESFAQRQPLLAFLVLLQTRQRGLFFFSFTSKALHSLHYLGAEIDHAILQSLYAAALFYIYLVVVVDVVVHTHDAKFVCCALWHVCVCVTVLPRVCSLELH